MFGPIAVTYNLQGVDKLALDGPTAAKIFNGGISQWNDPAIAALNSGKTLPAEKINVVYRNDESGTTDNFQKYLDGASDGAWGKGAGKTFNGGVGEGAKGNEGTSAAIKSTAGAITYNEWSFAKSQNLSIASIVTSAGPDPVEISTDSVGKTIAGAKVKGTGNDLVLDTTSFYKPTEPGAYPIVLATYEIVCSKYADADTGKAVKAFLQATRSAPDRTDLADNGYIPIPDEFKIEADNRHQRHRLMPLETRTTAGSRTRRAPRGPGGRAWRSRLTGMGDSRHRPTMARPRGSGAQGCRRSGGSGDVHVPAAHHRVRSRRSS